jgi:CBS domain-containing protein
MVDFVGEVMKKEVVMIDSSLTVKDAARKMKEAGIGCVVVTEKNVPVGILTERDFVRKIAANEKPMSTPIKDVMTSPLILIDPDSTLWELAELMKQKKIHRVPVVDENKLVGIITATDITRICSIGSDSEMRKVCEQILLRLNPSSK